MNVAAIDIGTNSVRLLITDSQGQTLLRHIRITQLGQGVDVAGALHPDAIARTCAVLAEYREALERHDVRRARATATSAARDAKNSAAFFDTAERALGLRPELLSGLEEAGLAFAGATAGLAGMAPAPFLVIDIGGGSTEFVLGTTGPEQLLSVNMGCVRMTERYFQRPHPAPEDVRACDDEVRAVLRDVRRSVAVDRARTVVGVAGTVTALAHAQQGLTEYDPSRTHRSILRRADVDALFARLCQLDVAGRQRLLVEPRRADVILGGTAVLKTVLSDLAIDPILVSETDLLDGLAAALRAEDA